jgi:hypothetical protein
MSIVGFVLLRPLEKVRINTRERKGKYNVRRYTGILADVAFVRATSLLPGATFSIKPVIP